MVGLAVVGYVEMDNSGVDKTSNLLENQLVKPSRMAQIIDKGWSELVNGWFNDGPMMDNG